MTKDMVTFDGKYYYQRIETLSDKLNKKRVGGPTTTKVVDGKPDGSSQED